jgi:hypothetical protein
MDEFDTLVGEWTTEATHPAFRDTVVHGHAAFEWLEGRQFLINRARNEHPDFPDSISIIGPADEGIAMHYFDSRGVHRIYMTSFDGRVRRGRRHDHRPVEAVGGRRDLERRSRHHLSARSRDADKYVAIVGTARMAGGAGAVGSSLNNPPRSRTCRTPRP